MQTDWTKHARSAIGSERLNFPKLSRAEDEDITQRCVLALRHLQSIMPDALTELESIKYPSEQYTQMVERMRDIWVRRRNLFRVFEITLRTNFDLNKI
jgi:hypothetical protein